MGYTFAIPNEERRVGQSAKTPPFHGGMTGSTPVRGTLKEKACLSRLSLLTYGLELIYAFQYIPS